MRGGGSIQLQPFLDGIGAMQLDVELLRKWGAGVIWMLATVVKEGKQHHHGLLECRDVTHHVEGHTPLDPAHLERIVQAGKCDDDAVLCFEFLNGFWHFVVGAAEVGQEGCEAVQELGEHRWFRSMLDLDLL